MPYDCSVELSHLGYQFFTDIFMMFDKDRDGSLNSTELNDLFSTSPGNPWTALRFPDTTTAEAGAVTLQGWLAQWRCARSFFGICAMPRLNFLSMTTLLDHKTTLEYLAYLGYPGDSTTSALQVTKPRKADRKKGKSSRNVFLTYVCGAAGSGKTSFLRNFAGKPYLDAYHPTNKPISVVNSVDIDGSEKYLVVSPRNKPGSYSLMLFQDSRVWIVI